MERIKMVVRKKYDHWGIEITTWNKTNVVAYVDCDCGQLARRELEKKFEKRGNIDKIVIGNN
ncbi:hypothetical protein [Enterococcus faecalis]|uniref:hypothetical protein n=1 Tax=Enterococcus faecalis TaxID=1351 RepID=UPI001AD7714F|nr:hypothetical protein [Enterococcus faecalis]MBO6462029.1 hypothetical protein [Enterococcus faecalis]